MLSKDEINDAYFNWIYGTVCEGRFAPSISFRKLLMRLHDIEFRYYIAKDSSRYDDGLALRYRFALDNQDIEDAERYLDGPCSVLEMMFALALRMEETIMCNTTYGDRTGQWFWNMITNMGLGSMENRMYDKLYVDRAVKKFIERKYEPDGKGGLFFIRDCDEDLRDVEIWYQMCWYLNTIATD